VRPIRRRGGDSKLEGQKCRRLEKTMVHSAFISQAGSQRYKKALSGLAQGSFCRKKIFKERAEGKGTKGGSIFKTAGISIQEERAGVEETRKNLLNLDINKTETSQRERTFGGRRYGSQQLLASGVI